MQPSDSLGPSASALVSLAFGLPRMRALVSSAACVLACGRPWALHPRGGWLPGPRHPSCFRGASRASQVPGPSSCSLPWSDTPPRAAAPCALPGDCRHGRNTDSEPLGTADCGLSWLFTHGPSLACLRIAVRRDNLSPGARRKAGYRPAGLSSGRTGFAPAGRHTEFREVVASFTPFRPAFPGRTSSSPGGSRSPGPSPEPDEEISTIRLLRWGRLTSPAPRTAHGWWGVGAGSGATQS